MIQDRPPLNALEGLTMTAPEDESYEMEVTVSFMTSAQPTGSASDPHEIARTMQEQWLEDPAELGEVVRASEDFDLQVRPLWFQ